MILNLTDTPLGDFTAMQRLATHREQVVQCVVSVIQDFYDVYDRLYNDISQIIVDPDRVELNDYVVIAAMCRVVTLDIETDADTGRTYFLNYNQ